MKGLNFPASTTLVSPTSAMFPISLGNLAVDSFRESSQRCGLKVTTMPTTPDKCTAPFLASEEAWMWQLGTKFEQLNTWRWIEWYWMDPGCKAVLDYFPLAHASWWWRGDSANLASLMSWCTNFKQENRRKGNVFTVHLAGFSHWFGQQIWDFKATRWVLSRFCRKSWIWNLRILRLRRMLYLDFRVGKATFESIFVQVVENITEACDKLLNHM